MTTVFDEKGSIVPVTVVQASPNHITQVKTVETDGYNAVQLGFDDIKPKYSTMPLIGHAGKAGVGPKRHFREIRLKDKTDKTAGAAVDVNIFGDVKFVDVIGVSKGKGFQGVVKRHHFGGGPKSHGSMFQVTGSIGSSAFPSRVFKGMRMSGHMGNARVTVRNLRILGVDKDDNLLVVEGAVPGPNGGYLVITKAKKPPRERRGFAGAATVDPLKAAKRAAKKG